MSERTDVPPRIIHAVHGPEPAEPDPRFEREFAQFLKNRFESDERRRLYDRFILGDGLFEMLMRRVLFRSLVKRLGNDVSLSPSVSFRHPETFDIGDHVFLGANAYIQGRIDGRCVIGNHVWIGPYSYFDARDMVIEDYVGWGPGAKVLGSEHVGLPVSEPIIKTDLHIRPVRVEEWADIGANSMLLPGVTIGKGALVGAGALVNRNVPPFAVVAGVPARFIRWREGYNPGSPNTARSDEKTGKTI